MIASVLRKALFCSAVSSCLVGTAAFAADPAVSTTGGLPGYDVIKAPASIAKLERVKQKLVKPDAAEGAARGAGRDVHRREGNRG